MGRRIVVLCWTLLAAALGEPSAAEGPRIALAETKFDFGKVVDGTPVALVFEISNAGDAALEITKVQPT